VIRLVLLVDLNFVRLLLITGHLSVCMCVCVFFVSILQAYLEFTLCYFCHCMQFLVCFSCFKSHFIKSPEDDIFS
jgi:hypothetical protein